jgi:hypothetical protein
VTYDPLFYPPQPKSGDNGIGLFDVGVSQLGAITQFDWRKTIASQYANSPILLQIIQNFAECIDPTQDIESFFDTIFNLETASGYGLDVWGRRVGAPRQLVINTSTFFGFQEAGMTGFGGAPFWSGQNPTTATYTVDDLTYRRMIIAKAAANITDGSIPSFNRILLTLFPGRGNCYVGEVPPQPPYFGFKEAGQIGFGGAPFYAGQTIPKMEIYYVFTFLLSPVELAIITASGILPRPSGVKATLVYA